MQLTQIFSSSQIALGLFIIFVGMGIGGGLYEVLVVYPLWKNNPTPESLAQRLKDSGQATAARRFWPFISPVAFLLAIWNIVNATQASGEVKVLWLAAAIAIALKSVATYAYFAPTMIRKLERANHLDPAELIKTVKCWTTLSPLRLWVEVPAWIAALCVFTQLGRNR